MFLPKIWVEAGGDVRGHAERAAKDSSSALPGTPVPRTADQRPKTPKTVALQIATPVPTGSPMARLNNPPAPQHLIGGTRSATRVDQGGWRGGETGSAYSTTCIPNRVSVRRSIASTA